MLPDRECSGCGLCAEICPKRCILMKENKDGFLYPYTQKEQCIRCGKCERLCPVLQSKEDRSEKNNVPDAYACYLKDEIIRKESSSGGVFSAIAKYVFNLGGVVCGASYNEKLEIEHVIIEEESQLYKLRGSKYVQSSILDCYSKLRKYLEEGKLVLFSGTPCQRKAVQSFLGSGYDNLILVDIICHGVPSKKVWHEYRRWVEKKNGSPVISANFRDKCSGWERFSLSMLLENGKTHVSRIDSDVYMQMFLKNYALRNSCYQCHFKGLSRETDFTLGDLWGIDEIIPELNDQKGISALFVQSEKGKKIMENLKDFMYLFQTDACMVAEKNGAMKHSVYRQPMRDYFYHKLGKMDFEKLALEVQNPGRKARIERKLLQLFDRLL